ncbi:MAG: diguanylate cyclase [Thermodesulfobacteriota bacterium]|jgi:diguanylate cyclase (GGDEF)-like protein|nr:diguanylate cyclase [Thermodesulfobacteriota bacterium]
MDNSILIVDDSKVGRQHILEILQQNSLFNRYFEAGDGLEGFKKVVAQPVDVVLCDVDMPGIDGFKFLAMVKTREELRDIPVIMLTGKENREDKIRGLELGASDYVTKPFDPGELIARVKVQLKVKSLQDSLKESNQLLLELSNTDPLTRLANRRHLMETLTREFKRSSRGEAPFSLIMVDIDHFKKFNDTFGHQAGDEVLTEMASLLRRHLREYDLAARYGGEEFALVLPDSDLEMAVQVAERLRTATGELSFGGNMVNEKISVSLGVACYPCENIHSVDDLIRIADDALYLAKKEGRDCVRTMHDLDCS